MSFKLWDVDKAGNFTDQISNISAALVRRGGRFIPPLLLAAAIIPSLAAARPRLLGALPLRATIKQREV